MKSKDLLDLFETILIGIVCPFAFLIDNNPISTEDTGGKEIGK